VSNFGTIDTDKTDGCHRADKRAVFDDNVSSFVALGLRPKITQTGAATDVNCSAARIFKTAPLNRDVAAAPLGLHTICSKITAMAECAAADLPLMTADHVDPGPTTSPTLDRTVLDPEISDS
jgi:hypothetical protein